MSGAAKKKHTFPKRNDRVPPTPETALKHHPDPLAFCEPEEQIWALEIARIHSHITGRLASRAQRYERTGRSNSDPQDWLSTSRGKAKRAVYNEWMRRLTNMYPYPHAVIDVITEMVPAYVQDMKYCQDKGTVGGWVMAALKLYGDLRK